MNQTVRYIIITLLIIALAIWSITVYRSCQEAKDPVVPEDNTAIDIDTSDLEDLYTEDIDTTGDEFADEESFVDTKEINKPTSGFSEPATEDYGDGKFLVVAGAFVTEANAKKVVNRLKQQGYNNAEIRVFIGSQYHSVIVGAYDNMDDAFDVAIKLANAEYKDAYVHKKRPKKIKK